MDFLKNLRYPGRFIILGKDGEDFVAIYGVTGRSASSLARRYVQEGNEIIAVQTAEGGNPELLTYPAFRFVENGIIVANGNVTLKGVVASDMDKTIAYLRASGVPGVFSVTNHLRVGS